MGVAAERTRQSCGCFGMGSGGAPPMTPTRKQELRCHKSAQELSAMHAWSPPLLRFADSAGFA